MKRCLVQRTALLGRVLHIQSLTSFFNCPAPLGGYPLHFFIAFAFLAARVAAFAAAASAASFAAASACSNIHSNQGLRCSALHAQQPTLASLPAHLLPLLLCPFGRLSCCGRVFRRLLAGIILRILLLTPLLSRCQPLRGCLLPGWHDKHSSNMLS